MPSKKSKPSPKQAPHRPPEFRLWKAASDCSEVSLVELASKLALQLGAEARVLLEGPMGAGKTTFSRALLKGLGVEQPPEGSPSFAIAHEYRARRGTEVVHIDFYRIRAASEIQDSGIEAYFWERKAVVLAEWMSLWPDFEAAVVKSGSAGNLWRVELAFVSDQMALRSVRISKLNEAS